MRSRGENRTRVVNGSRTVALVLTVAWVLFAIAGLAYMASAQIATRPVTVNGVFKGNVELFNLVSGAVNVRFCPVNSDQNIFSGCGLNWVQIANRPNSTAYPRVDPPNNLGGYPNKSTPFYWDNWAGTSRNNIMYSGGYYWMQDQPTPGIEFETWLVNSSGNNISRLVCFNWAVPSVGPPQQPSFINNSKYNWANALQKSNLPSYWTIAATPSAGIPTATEWGLILLTTLLIVAGAAFMKRARAI